MMPGQKNIKKFIYDISTNYNIMFLTRHT